VARRALGFKPRNLPRRLEDLHQEVALLMPPERRTRAYARAVKIKMSGYAQNRSHRSRRG
jgi:hypothetical protein